MTEVHQLDRLVDGLLGQLEASGLTGRTLGALTPDRGQEFMEHGGDVYGHSLYNEVLGMPLILTNPGIVSPGAAGLWLGHNQQEQAGDGRDPRLPRPSGSTSATGR